MSNISVNQITTTLSNRFSRLSEYLLVFGLAGGGITNVLLYYIGIHNTDFRGILFIIFAIMLFCLACLRFLQIYITLFGKRRMLLLSITIPIFGLLIFVGAFAIFGKSATKTIGLLLQYGCFCIPSFIFGLDCILHRRELALFRTLDIISILYIPFVVVCVYTLFDPSNLSGSIATVGSLNYMSIAYILLLPLASLIVSFVLLPDRLFLSIKTDSFRRINSIICFGLALLFWYVILCTGTRGPMVCVFIAVVFLMIWTAFIRNKRSFLRSVVIFLSLTLMFVLLMFLIKADYSSLAAGRMQYFVDNLLQGKFKTSTTEAVSQAELDKIITSMPVAEKETVSSASAGADTSLKHTETEATIEPSNIVMNREELYYAAIGEFLKNPIYGIGPLGFYIKYNTYVHNAALEVLCNYGVVGVLIIFGTVLGFSICLIKISRKKLISSAMLALLICTNLPLLVSATLITWPPFWFFMGYAGLGAYDIYDKYRISSDNQHMPK